MGAADPSVDPAAVYRLVHERNRCGYTPINSDTAVVHARVEGLERLRVAIATSEGGFACAPGHVGSECEEQGLVSVKLLVLILAPADDPVGYLRAIEALEAACRKDGFVERVSVLQDPLEAWKAFDQAGSRLPDYVTARDLMRTDFARLRDTDTLSHAIDLFCTERMSELPVVDADGDLVGLVTEDELLRVCLPEYVTWMEDLSPILDFQPFAELLRRESSVPAMEIMVFAERYATVQETTPAIQVAKVMLRRDVWQVLVVRDRELLGIVSIQDLIHKVLRA